MKNLIIHPADPTTSFLSPIYALLQSKTVIDDGVTKSELRELIEKHDRVIVMGHGTPDGLMSVDQFPEAGFHIIDESMVDKLCEKKDSIYIWCDADFFLWLQDLNGLCSGMFISEIDEGQRYGFKDCKTDLIFESNKVFASVMARHINEPNDELYRNLVSEYGYLAKRNPISYWSLEITV